jgi:hypothetical protein
MVGQYGPQAKQAHGGCRASTNGRTVRRLKPSKHMVDAEPVRMAGQYKWRDSTAPQASLLINPGNFGYKINRLEAPHCHAIRTSPAPSMRPPGPRRRTVTPTRLSLQREVVPRLKNTICFATLMDTQRQRLI